MISKSSGLLQGRHPVSYRIEDMGALLSSLEPRWWAWRYAAGERERGKWEDIAGRRRIMEERVRTGDDTRIGGRG